MKLENVTRDDWIVGGLALLLAIFLLVLPWFSVGGGTGGDAPVTMTRSAPSSRRRSSVGVMVNPVDVRIGRTRSAHTAYRYRGRSGSIAGSPNISLAMPSSKAGTGSATTTATSVSTPPEWHRLRHVGQICHPSAGTGRT